MRRVTVVLLALGLLWGAMWGFSSGNMSILFALVGVPILIYLINHKEVWLLLVFGSFYSWLYLPGLPASLSLFYILSAVLVPVLIASRCLVRTKYPVGRLTFFSVCGYLAVLLITMKVRGFGIKLFGGGTWGGADYVHLIIIIFLYMFHDTILFNKKYWKIALILFFGAGLIPSLAEIIFIFSKGSSTFLYHFVRPEGVSALGSLSAMTQQSGVLRLQVSKYIGYLFPMFLALFPFSKRYRKYIILAGAIAILSVGMSGHRSAVLYFSLLIPAFVYTTNRRISPRSIALVFVVLFSSVVFVHFTAEYMPLAFQRAISWIPFADVAPDARASAASTLSWRMELWKILWRMVPDYMAMGRGFAFDALAMSTHAGQRLGSIDWAIITHNYHSGPLSLLVDLGLAGFVFGTLIFITGVFTQMGFRRRVWFSKTLSRYHALLLASFSVDILRFYVIHGNAASSVVAALIQLAMMEGIVRTDMMLHEQSQSEDDLPGSGTLVLNKEKAVL